MMHRYKDQKKRNHGSVMEHLKSTLVKWREKFVQYCMMKMKRKLNKLFTFMTVDVVIPLKSFRMN